MFKKYTLLTLSLLFATNACLVVTWDGKEVYNMKKGKGQKEKIRDKQNKAICTAIINNDVSYLPDKIIKIERKRYSTGVIEYYDHNHNEEVLDNVCRDIDFIYGAEDSNSVLNAAYFMGSCEVAKALQEKGVKNNKGGIDAYGFAVISRLLDTLDGLDDENEVRKIIGNLIKCGFNVNAKSNISISHGSDFDVFKVQHYNVRAKEYYLRDWIDRNYWQIDSKKSAVQKLQTILAEYGGKKTGEGKADIEAMLRAYREENKRKAEARAAQDAYDAATGGKDMICLDIRIYNDVPENVEITHPPYNQRGKCTSRKYATGTWTYKFNVREAGLINRPIRNSCSGSISINASDVKYEVELYFRDYRSCQAEVRKH